MRWSKQQTFPISTDFIPIRLFEVPIRWKHAFVTPNSKKLPLNKPGNYRSVNITSIFARTFEKIFKKLVHIIAAWNQHSDLQHGFMVDRWKLLCLHPSMTGRRQPKRRNALMWCTSTFQGLLIRYRQRNEGSGNSSLEKIGFEGFYQVEG